jgi:hypothetical protein
MTTRIVWRAFKASYRLSALMTFWLLIHLAKRSIKRAY